jgi:hypothetical protein
MHSPKTSLIRIRTPGFIAGVVLANETNKITLAAPILRYMLGWSEEQLVSFLASKPGWDVDSVCDEY